MFIENMVRGLDDEETEFLEEVSQKQQELEKSKMKEEKELLDQFKISFALWILRKEMWMRSGLSAQVGFRIR